jgi:elongation factor P hydroxylase
VTAQLATFNRAAQGFSALRLEQVFNQCFADSFNTRLVGGAAEPFYQPAANGVPALLFYREDYFASALHEISHWCIAGEQRRTQADFGYWYAPEGRSAEQQQQFESVEAKPQAVEWYLSRACGYRFRLSVDNLEPVNGRVPDTTPFARAVLQQALLRKANGLPSRAQRFFDALCEEFNTGHNASQLPFELRDLAL